MKKYSDLLSEMDQYKTKADGPFDRSQKRKKQSKQQSDSHTDYKKKMAQDARWSASREKIERPGVERQAAAEPITLKNVQSRARAIARKRGGRDTKPGLGDYARGAASTKIKKEKQRFKTDPVGTTKKYAGAAGNAVKGVASGVKKAMNPNSKSVGATGGTSSTERGVRYQ